MKFTNKILDKLISLNQIGWRLGSWGKKDFFHKGFTKIYLHPSLNKITYNLAIKEIEKIERERDTYGHKI